MIWMMTSKTMSQKRVNEPRNRPTKKVNRAVAAAVVVAAVRIALPQPAWNRRLMRTSKSWKTIRLSPSMMTNRVKKPPPKTVLVMKKVRAVAPAVLVDRVVDAVVAAAVIVPNAPHPHLRHASNLNSTTKRKTKSSKRTTRSSKIVTGSSWKRTNHHAHDAEAAPLLALRLCVRRTSTKKAMKIAKTTMANPNQR